MARKPFILTRNTQSKRFYAHFWDEESGQYIGKKTTGETTKAKATIAATKMLTDGGPRRSEFAVDYLKAFWRMDGDYVKGRIARGSSMSALYVKTSAQRLEHSVLLP